MGPVLRSLAPLAILLVVVQGQLCRRGKFGPKCAYDCHCSAACDQKTGRCPEECVQPWSGPSCQRENVAYKKRATSSGTHERFPQWTADKAVDGDRNQNVEGDSCFISSRRDSTGFLWGSRAMKSWLTLDLGRPYHTRHMTVFGRNRTFSPARLKNTRMYVSNSSKERSSPCYTFPGGYSRGFNIVDLTCDGVGRYVTLYDNDVPPGDYDPSAFMEICEIEIYVCAPGWFGKDCEGRSHYREDSCDLVAGGDGCQEICAAGFLGNDCTARCQETQFGENCASTCHCRTPGCDDITGECHKPGCLDGYYGLNCSSDIDECVEAEDVCGEAEDVCGEDAACVNTPGSFLCAPFNQSTGCSQEDLMPLDLAGGIAGGTALLLLLETVVLVFCYCYQQRRKRPQVQAPVAAKSLADEDNEYVYVAPDDY